MMVNPARYTDQMRQEQISRNQLSERLAEFGWVIAAPVPDLGEDFVVHIYFEGRATGVMFHVQEKSVTNLHERRKDDHLVYKNIAVKDVIHWEACSLPVVLIVWDVTLREGRWALMNDVIADLDQRLTDWRDKQAVRVRLPWRNRTDDAGLVQLRQQVGQCLFPLIARHSSGEPDVVLPPLRLLHEAERLGQRLVEEFDVAAVYLFGSLAWGSVFSPETDIDLAVSGLPAARYLDAVGFVERESNFSVDLVDLNQVSEEFSRRIVTEGKLLYERDPVAAAG
ncbi:MAG: DUF4365 domain-containing protein [Chloroflexaceae bacterium]